ncbi:MAG: cytochrome P460 family protein, partial [Anaerolineae bacterium]|nr:cytochrome P460 family protein [Anaerolineae bacterium]
RDLYINPEAVAALRQGQPLPENTIIVIEGYHAEVGSDGNPVQGVDGHYLKAAPLAMLHVAHRRSDWTDADFPSVVRAGRWNFGSFDVQSGARFDEDLSACFNCHQAMIQTDFLYTTADLLRYVRTQEPQYQFCNLRRRLPC